VGGTSYFCAPSKYDFFGGYDHSRDCGIVHVADHHISPGKKNFQWGLNKLGDAWNDKLTDLDGEHAELMAGCFTDDQPDFAWLAPYETKVFSQFWYPIHGVKAPTFANTAGAINVDRAAGTLRVAVTTAVAGARVRVSSADQLLLDAELSLEPSTSAAFQVAFTPDRYRVQVLNGTAVLLDYTEERPEVIRMPKDNPGIPTPHALTTAQQIAIAGRHVDQYRDPLWSGEEYFTVALERDPEHLPSLIWLAEHRIAQTAYDQALQLLKRAEAVQNIYNQSPSDGSVAYFKARALLGLGRVDEAYDTAFKASWSENVIPGAMTLIAGIDGCRGDYDKMLEHAGLAIETAARNPVSGSYAAFAAAKLGDIDQARDRLTAILADDPLNQLARFGQLMLSGAPASEFFGKGLVNSNPTQTALDVAFDLLAAGFNDWTVALLTALGQTGDADAMAWYTLGYVCELQGDATGAAAARAKGSVITQVQVFPYRAQEIDVLQAALSANPYDATAHYLLGCILYDKKRYTQAGEHWQQAIDLAPDFYPSYRNLAIACYSKLNRRVEALPLLRHALELQPGDDILLKETVYVMAHTGVPPTERRDFLLERWPAKPSDNLVMDMANIYIDTGEFAKAVSLLEEHHFVPAECSEVYLTDAWTTANFALGREAMAAGDHDAAVDLFQAAQVEPEHFDAGWWDTGIMFFAQYFEAEALDRAGRIPERDAAILKVTHFKESGMSPYMGPERWYYVAKALRLAGDEIGARKLLSDKIVAWTAELDSDLDRKLPSTSLFISYVDDPEVWFRSTMLTALGFGRLFFGDVNEAKALFNQALALFPDSRSARLELRFI
jgi:tetratricopeptide (TPR) repeat protein